MRRIYEPPQPLIPAHGSVISRSHTSVMSSEGDGDASRWSGSFLSGIHCVVLESNLSLEKESLHHRRGETNHTTQPSIAARHLSIYLAG